MKIPDKKVINIQFAEQRKRQIDDGVRLAKKIDAMREDFLKLQKQRAEFIEQSRSELEKATQGYYEKIENLKLEIQTLEEVKVKLKDLINGSTNRGEPSNTTT